MSSSMVWCWVRDLSMSLRKFTGAILKVTAATPTVLWEYFLRLTLPSCTFTTWTLTSGDWARNRQVSEPAMRLPGLRPWSNRCAHWIQNGHPIRSFHLGSLSLKYTGGSWETLSDKGTSRNQEAGGAWWKQETQGSEVWRESRLMVAVEPVDGKARQWSPAAAEHYGRKEGRGEGTPVWKGGGRKARSHKLFLSSFPQSPPININEATCS